jgi:hypothetical protein
MPGVQQLIVRADLPKRRRRYRVTALVLTVLYGIMAALLGVQMGLLAHITDGIVTALLFGALAGLLGFMFGALTQHGGGLRQLRAAASLSRIMTIDPAGLWFAHALPLGTEVFLPWAIVGSVRRRPWMRNEVLLVTLRPGVRPDHPGAYGLDDPKLWRALNGDGMLIGLRDTVPDREQVVAAIAHHLARPVENR